MAITIVSKREGFRRCGVAHSEKPTTYPNDQFTKAELKALKAEPMLIVTETPDKPPKPADGQTPNDPAKNK